MKKKIISAAFLSVLMMNGVVANQVDVFTGGKWSAGIGISTLGFGANIAYKFNESFKLRAVINTLTVNRNFKNTDVSVNSQLRLLTTGLMADWHLLQNGFRLTGGLLYNGNRFRAHFTPSRNINISGRVYTPAQIGEVKGRLDFRKIAPYFGIGYDSGHANKSGFALNGDIGLLFQGKVRGKVISMSGQSANSAIAINDMNSEFVTSINKSRWIKTYPVISVGISYKF